ncbi:hypothetical protein LHK_02808 [Laribacter hongkongensis HLHK9]|uniref:Uncharacterized protein n=1 Tax=Laribacter hongkongensis (strain HLHK9) TaxID=557598 RepID=C1DDF6_LARHH|nr:hypothetical protein LHK_02808 [Laribacter hongkongensis HLHK9]
MDNAVVRAVHGGAGAYDYGAALLEKIAVFARGYNGNGAWWTSCPVGRAPRGVCFSA